MVWVSVGIGLVASLLFAEFLGLTAGGLVVPGYIALFWDKPIHIIGTIIAAFMALLVLKILSAHAFIYGRRRLVLTILLGFIFAVIMRQLSAAANLLPEMSFDPIGFVIPGLIAYWMEKQGTLETLTSLITASAIVRFAIILINGGAPIDVVWF